MQIDLRYSVWNEIKRWSASMPMPVTIPIEVASIEDIIQAVCEITGVAPSSVKCRTRVGEVVFARHLIRATAHAMNKYGAGYSLSDIAKFNKGHHATVLYSVQLVSNFIDTKYKIDIITEVANHFYMYISDYSYKPHKQCKE